MEEKQQHGRWKYLMCIWFGIFCFPLIAIAAQGVIKVKGYFSEVQAIRQIEKNSNYVFFYDAADLDEVKRKNIDCQGTIEKVLSVVFEGSNVNYLVRGDEVVLKVNKQSVQQKGEKRVVTGVVTDAIDGEPLVGVNIVVKGQKSGTITDLNGRYSISVSGDKAVLVFSYIGYQKREAPVEDLGVVNVTMSGEQQTLNEVVVVGSGVQKKVSVTGAITNVKGDILRMPTSQLSTSFAGKLAGVIATTKTGEPGSGADFYIRGISTMNGATNPLIILDGVEISSGDLDNLDPEIIDGFSILKDATATAMYGTRGANGVMIITTKSGRNIDKPIINFRMEGQITSPTSKPKFVDGATYMDLFNESLLNGGSTESPYSAEEIAGTRAGLNPYAYPNVNWYDELFKDQAFNQNFNVNIRGGGKRVDYFSSVTVNHETGMIKNRSKDFFSYNNNINVMRYSFQNNINAYLGKDSRLSLRLNVQLRKTKQPNISMNDLFAGAINTSPVEAPIYFPDDGVTTHIKWGVNDRLKPGQQQNPVAQLASGYQDNFRSTVVAALEFEQKLNFITEGLRFKALASFKNWSSTTNSASAGWNKYHLQDFSVDDNGVYSFVTRLQNESGGEVSTDLKPGVANSGDRRFYFQAIMDYNRTFGKHDVNAMFIYNQDELVTQLFSGDLIAALPKRKQGVAARLSYAYDGKYLAEANFGYNGSETFQKGSRFGFFPSFAVGYMISNEEFFKPLNGIFTSLKLRASYGLVGNSDIGSGRFPYLTKVNLNGGGSYQFGKNWDNSASGTSISTYGADNVTWEIGEKYDIGVDMTLFKDLNFTIDYFRENRKNIFLQRQTISVETGITGTAPYGNLGRVKNEGLDMSFNYNHSFNKDFFISARGTFTLAKNEYVERDEPPYEYSYMSQVGQPLNNYYGYIAEGLFQSEDEIADSPTQELGTYKTQVGDIKYKDLNGDGKIDGTDKTYIGNPSVPQIIYGFGASMQYKGWDASFFFQGVAKRDIMLQGIHSFTGNTHNLMQWVVDNYWREDGANPSAEYPRLTNGSNPNTTEPSTYWLKDGSYIRLKNVELGYTWKFLRAYVAGANLLTFSKFKIWDPELNTQNGQAYPTQRTVSVGLQMTF